MKAPKGNWIVTARCEVTKQIFCEGCTEEEARANPFEYATSETEIDQVDYEVKDVEPNE